MGSDLAPETHHLSSPHEAHSPAAACVTAQKQFTALTAHGAVGLIAILVIHIEELQEAILVTREKHVRLQTWS